MAIPIIVPRRKPRWESNYISIWTSPDKSEQTQGKITREEYLQLAETPGDDGPPKPVSVPADWSWKSASEFPAYETASELMEEGNIDAQDGIIIIEGVRIKLWQDRITGTLPNITVQDPIVVNGSSYRITNGQIIL